MKERDKQIAQDYQKGYSYRQLAKEYKVSHTRIGQILDEQGVEKRPVGVPHNFKGE